MGLALGRGAGLRGGAAAALGFAVGLDFGTAFGLTVALGLGVGFGRAVAFALAAGLAFGVAFELAFGRAVGFDFGFAAAARFVVLAGGAALRLAAFGRAVAAFGRAALAADLPDAFTAAFFCGFFGDLLAKGPSLASGPSKWPAMILNSLQDRKRSIELFEQDEPRQSVRQGERAERQAKPTLAHQTRRQPEVGAEEEDDRPRPLRPPATDLARQPLGVELPTAPVERHPPRVGRRRSAQGDRLGLPAGRIGRRGSRPHGSLVDRVPAGDPLAVVGAEPFPFGGRVAPGPQQMELERHATRTRPPAYSGRERAGSLAASRRNSSHSS